MTTRNSTGPSGPRGRAQQRARDWIQAALFVAALSLPAFGYLLGINDFEMLAENRRLAERPTWPADRGALGRFPAAFERHFDDHFGFRSHLVGRDKRLEWLGRRTEVEIQVGLDGWLFQGDERSAADFACITPDPAVLTSWLDLGRVRRERLAELGIPFLWVMAPNKHTVHPEALPALAPLAQREGEACAAPALAEVFEAEAIDFLDLRPALRAARAEHALYHRTDTHWNQLGAAHAVSQIVESLRPAFPQMPGFALDDYRVVVEEEAFEGNLAARLRVYGERYDERFLRLEPVVPVAARLEDDASPLDLRVHSREDPRIELSTGRSELPTAVVFHDSFGFATMALLAEHFERIRFVNSNAKLDWALIEQDPPDVVIALFVEAKLLAKAQADGSSEADEGSSIAQADDSRRRLPSSSR